MADVSIFVVLICGHLQRSIPSQQLGIISLRWIMVTLRSLTLTTTFAFLDELADTFSVVLSSPRQPEQGTHVGNIKRLNVSGANWGHGVTEGREGGVLKIYKKLQKCMVHL